MMIRCYSPKLMVSKQAIISDEAMNTFLKAIVLAISTALVATPVMAAPQEHPSKQNTVKNAHGVQNTHAQKSLKQGNRGHNVKKSNTQYNWKVGQNVPNQYHGSNYKIDQSQYKKLSKPGHNQQWIKVKGDYILVNTLNHKVLKVIHS